MNHTTLLTSIYDYVSDIIGLPDIYFPNIDSGDMPKEYLAIYVLPAKPDDIGLTDVKVTSGIIQIDVMTKDGIGEIRASEIAQLVIEEFPRGTVIPTSNIRVDKTPYIVSGFVDGRGYYKVPISIEYNIIEA